MMAVRVLIVAAGSGKRFSSSGQATSSIRKQYLLLLGKPILAYSIHAFIDSGVVEGIHIVLSPDDHEFEARMAGHIEISLLHTHRVGGAERADSVANGLQAMMEKGAKADDWVLVHDAARPCIRPDTIRAMVAQLISHPIGGIVAVPLADTLKRADSATAPSQNPQSLPAIIATPNREHLWQAQTPQMFRHAMLLNALRAHPLATDEAMAIEYWLNANTTDKNLHPNNNGHLPDIRPVLFWGCRDNIKVTYAEDLHLAGAFLQKRCSRIS